MAGRFSRQFLDDLIARIDLVDLIDARVPLKKSGANYLACCPFHSEKSPSFTVSREKQFYHCFGCGAHGNAIGFLMSYDRLSFTEAVVSLAESVGLPLPEEPGTARGGGAEPALQALYAIQAEVAKFYSRQLRRHPDGPRAIAYLKQRGLNGEIARRYQIGYAPPGWRNLADAFDREALLRAGLLIARDATAYDRFRDRIMFPIRDRRGRVVGFGGRVLGEETPKYLNSPETPVFKKHEQVYGLYELLETVRRPERIVVVEGYLDVIALAQHGLPLAVATLGTATSGDHVELLFRYTDELIFCFDGDAAGRKAAWHALEASLPALRDGRTARFLHLPQGEDPDSLIRREGQDAFSRRLDAADRLSDYFFAQLAEGLDLATIEGRSALFRNAAPLLGKVQAGTFKTLMQEKLADLAGRRTTRSPRPLQPREPAATPARGAMHLPLERRLLALLLQNPRFFVHIDPAREAELLRQTSPDGLLHKLLRFLAECPRASTGRILERFRGGPEEAEIQSLLVPNTLLIEEGLETEFLDALKRIRVQWRDLRLEALIRKSRSGGLDEPEVEELRRLTDKSD